MPARDVERLRHVRDPEDGRALDDEGLGHVRLRADEAAAGARFASIAAASVPATGRTSPSSPTSPRKMSDRSRPRVEPEQERAVDDREREVERAADLPQVRRREVHHHPAAELEDQVLDDRRERASDPQHALADGGVREPDDAQRPDAPRRTSAAPRA